MGIMKEKNVYKMVELTELFSSRSHLTLKPSPEADILLSEICSKFLAEFDETLQISMYDDMFPGADVISLNVYVCDCYNDDNRLAMYWGWVLGYLNSVLTDPEV